VQFMELDQEKKRETRRIVFEEDNHMILVQDIIITSGKNIWMSLTQLT